MASSVEMDLRLSGPMPRVVGPCETDLGELFFVEIKRDSLKVAGYCGKYLYLLQIRW